MIEQQAEDGLEKVTLDTTMHRLGTTNRLKTNTLIVIGYIGAQVCYLNLSMDEATDTYESNVGPIDKDTPIKTIEFYDTFGAYDVYSIT